MPLAHPLWRPTDEGIARANLTDFMREANERFALLARLRGALALVGRFRDQFWQAIWSFCGVIAETQGSTVLVDGERMPGSRWFPNGSLRRRTCCGARMTRPP